MISVRKYNVGFGDYLKVSFDKTGKYSLLIDCGTNNEVTTEYSGFAASDLLAGCSMILTHFHDDHYKIMYDNRIPMEELFIRKPDNSKGFTEEIAAASLAILCKSDEIVRSSSSWFNADIINQLTNHFKYSKIRFFEDGECLIKQGGYRIVAVKFDRESYFSQIDIIIRELENVQEGLYRIIRGISEAYCNFVVSGTVCENTGRLLQDLLDYRRSVLKKKRDIDREGIENLYDKVLNDSSAIIGIYENDTIKCLFLADVGINSQKKVLEVTGEVPLLKVSHHGTANYNSPDIIQAFNPSQLILTYGENTSRIENFLAPFFETHDTGNIGSFEEYEVE